MLLEMLSGFALMLLNVKYDSALEMHCSAIENLLEIWFRYYVAR